MKKALTTLLAIISLVMMTTACTIQVDGMESTTNPSNEHQDQLQIQAKIDKRYEDGIDFKVQLTGAKNAKGTWTVKYYDSVQELKEQGTSAVAGFAYNEMEGMDKSNDENDVNLYVSFDGIADGQKVKLDKIYVVTKEEFNQTPLEREGDTEAQPQSLTWQQLKTNMDSGYLFNPNVFLDATKEEIIQELGEPDAEEADSLEYKNQNLTVGLDKNQLVDYIDLAQPKQLPQNIEEIAKAFGEPYHSEGAAGKTYEDYKVGDYYVTIAWSNVESHVSEIRLSRQTSF